MPSGTSIRDFNRHTDTKKNRPDYGFLKDNVCPFRGEEKHSESREDPKAELSDKLTWIYSPAPYVFGEHNYPFFVSPHHCPSRVGYYAIGPDLTLAAICAPSTPSQTPVVLDLASANLRFKRDRIASLCRLINLSPYLYPLLKLIGYRDVPEFTVIERYVLSYHLGGIIDVIFKGRQVRGNWDKKCQKGLSWRPRRRKGSIYSEHLSPAARERCTSCGCSYPRIWFNDICRTERNCCQTKQREGTARCHHLCSTSTPGMYHNIMPVYVNSHHIIGSPPSTAIIP